MLKITSSTPIDISNSSLIIVFAGEGSSSAVACSLLISNCNFQSVGYLYSTNLQSTAFYASKDSKRPSFNGEVFFNQEKKVTLLDISSGYSEGKTEAFSKELITFIQGQKFKEVYFLGSISKSNIVDFEIRSKVFNVYYMTNDEKYKNDFGFLGIKDAFQLEEKEKGGKKYKEMEELYGCEGLRRMAQKFVLEKVNFVFVFAFAEEGFDPLCGLALYEKISFVLKLKENENKVEKKEIGKDKILEEIEKNYKVDPVWRTYLIE